MSNIKYLETLVCGLTLAVMICPQAWAVVQTGNDCNGKCTWTYDSEAEGGPSLVFTAKDGSSGNLEIKNNYYRFYGVNGGYNLNLQPKNVTIGEGITTITPGGRAPLENLGVGGGKLTLPSTLTEWQCGSSWGMSFATIEINSEELTIGKGAIRNNSPTGVTTIIMPASEKIVFDDKALNSDGGSAGRPFTQTLNIQCKGAKSACDKSLAGVKATIEANGGTYKSDYYQEKDKNNNVTLQYFDDGYRSLNEKGFYDVYDFSNKIVGYSNLRGNEIYDQSGNLIERYDENGNMLDGKQTRADGLIATLKDGKIVGLKKNSVFNLTEVTELLKNDNSNTVTLTFK